MIFENFNISENDIISVELAQGTKVLIDVLGPIYGRKYEA
jgi:hypothetical protein